MSKYDPLWEYVGKSGSGSLKLTFEEIQIIAGFPIDHSFLKYKKELERYGWQVGKISMKEQTVLFLAISRKMDSPDRDKSEFYEHWRPIEYEKETSRTE